MNPTQILFGINSEFEKVPKMNIFLERRYHIIFEKADLKNKREWFNTAKEKGYLKAMISHRNSTKGIFEWNNFDNWLSEQNLEEDVPPVK